LERKFGGSWVRRTGPTGIYNCAGLVWASRRTAIYHDEEWDQVLREDEYTELGDVRDVSIGDIAVYTSEGAGYLHVGVVFGTEVVFRQGQRVPRILSKWDDMSGEYFHLAPNIPFASDFPDWTVSYWTDRR
jgi:hypothetical protein